MNRKPFQLLIFLVLLGNSILAQQSHNAYLDIYIEGYSDQDTIPKNAFKKQLKLFPKTNSLNILEYSIIIDRVGHGADWYGPFKSDTLPPLQLASGNIYSITITSIRAKNKYAQILYLNERTYNIRPL